VLTRASELRAYKCIVDLERDVLVFGGSGGVEVAFLTAERAHAYTDRLGNGSHPDGVDVCRLM
jgi:hypothetical protein